MSRTDVGTVEDLHASATKVVGLDDFGGDDDNYLQALGVLLESYRDEAGLTELGSKMSRFFLRNALVARLMSEAAWKANPGYAAVPIERPIFVTGLPRSFLVDASGKPLRNLDPAGFRLLGSNFVPTVYDTTANAQCSFVIFGRIV